MTCCVCHTMCMTQCVWHSVYDTMCMTLCMTHCVWHSVYDTMCMKQCVYIVVIIAGYRHAFSGVCHVVNQAMAGRMIIWKVSGNGNSVTECCHCEVLHCKQMFLFRFGYFNVLQSQQPWCRVQLRQVVHKHVPLTCDPCHGLLPIFTFWHPSIMVRHVTDRWTDRWRPSTHNALHPIVAGV